jgi:hypothetical protein
MPTSYTQEEVEHKARVLLNLPGGMKYTTINEITNMSEGESEYGLREQHYPGKPDQFFKDVLKTLRRLEEERRAANNENNI